MSTPYWGALDPPIQIPRRNSVRRSGEVSKDDQNALNAKRTSGSQRVSLASTMDSTLNSQVVSPTGSYFPDALAPRPPSSSYGAQEYQDGQSKKRRQRESQEIDNLYSTPLSLQAPEVPDVPHAPPPLSYKTPYNKGSAQIPTRSRPKRRTDEALEAQSDREVLVGSKDIGPTNRESEKGVLAKDVPKGNTFPRRSERVSILDTSFTGGDNSREERPTTSQSSSKISPALEPDSKRRDWALDRSPLQRLELALGSLTKEEKRARAEEAELMARTVPKRTSSVSNRAQGKTAASSPTVRSGPVSAVETSRTYSGTNIKSKIDSPQPREEQGVPSRGASFRERAAVALGSGKAAEAMGATHGSLSQNSSKRIKKEPPGDPWYSRRKEAENAFRDIRPKGYQDSPTETHDKTREVVDDGMLSRQGSTRKVEQLAGKSTNGVIDRNKASNKFMESMQYDTDEARLPEGMVRIGYDADEGTYTFRDTDGSIWESAPGNRYGRLTRISGSTRFGGADPKASNVIPNTSAKKIAAIVSAGDSEHHQHHVSDYIPGHHARDRYRPGDGLYLAPEPFKEWRQESTAFLSAAYTNLDAKQTDNEKNKAWWEAEDSGKLRSRPPRSRVGRSHDEQTEDSTGTVFSYLPPDKDGTAADRIPVGDSQRVEDPVSAPVREYVGYEDVPTNPAKLEPSNKSRTKNEKLTAAARSIRVRPTIVSTIFNPKLYLKCGPLLRYKGIRREPETSQAARKKGVMEREIWRGSVLIVTADEYSDYITPPTLRVFSQPKALPPPPPSLVDGPIDNLAPEYVDPIVGMPKIARDGSTLYVRPVEDLDFGVDLSRNETDAGLFEKQSIANLQRSGFDGTEDNKNPARGSGKRDGEKVGKYLEVVGTKLDVVQGKTFWRFNIEVELASHPQRIAYRINRGPATGFWVPSRGEAMNIMFYSCNGFTDNVDPDPLSGPDPLWRDVLNSHQTQPFHCMIGGGDQLYMDQVRTETELFRDWLTIKDPFRKHKAPLNPEMQLELETFYMDRYCMWFSQGLFGLANSQIAMTSVWDDHDIIDGFGSYPDSFMSSPVFMGLGAVAYRFYLLFQHHTIIDEGEESEPSWIIGPEPGPWIGEHSRSVYLSLGGPIAFLGLDCRTERTRDEILSRETYSKVFERCRKELKKGGTKHLIILLGVPIAYPRLVWLENILTSRLLDPIKAAGRMGFFKDFINEFDGGVEILDDLDDHWCAKNHKAERNFLIEELLQKLAAEYSIRVTILGGDVHLGAIGRFYSNPTLRIPKDRDFRYMPNVISSAIVNEAPPSSLADLLNKRNRVHHLNKETDESMVPIFTHDVDNKPRNNKCLLPRRNWCSIKIHVPGNSPSATSPVSVFDGSDRETPSPQPRGGFLRRKIRGPSYTPDATSRPPLSGSILRKLSISRGRTSTDGKRPNGLTRTLSLSRNDFVPGIFRRNSSKRKPNDGGINGYGSESEESLQNDSQTSIANSAHFSARPRGKHEATQSDGNINNPHSQVHQRGGAGEEERPAFRRTQTDLARKEMQASQSSINLAGGLEITLNMEREQGDPAGITVPYQFLVPALWYDINNDGLRNRRPSALERIKSFGKGRITLPDRY